MLVFNILVRLVRTKTVDMTNNNKIMMLGSFNIFFCGFIGVRCIIITLDELCNYRYL